MSEPRRNWNAILRDAQERGLTLGELAAEQGVSAASASKARTKHRVTLKKNPPGRKPLCDWPAVLADAQRRDLRTVDVAKEQHVSRACVSLHCERLGIRLRGATRSLERAA